jgi:hypothetical protein
MKQFFRIASTLVLGAGVMVGVWHVTPSSSFSQELPGGAQLPTEGKEAAAALSVVQPEETVLCPHPEAGCDPHAGTDGDEETGQAPWWRNVPPVQPMRWSPFFVIPPTGPGYYSLMDVLQGNYRQAPPKWPYPRFGIIANSFFDQDFRYLDNPNNQDRDPLDFLHRIHVGDNFLFNTGGEFRCRYNNETDSRLTGRDNTYDLTRIRAYGDFWFRDIFRIYAEFIQADTFYQDLDPLIVDRNHGDLLNLFADLRTIDLFDRPIWFRGGRQELLYGAQRLISPLDWVNTRRTFEGGKLFWQGEDLSIDLFCVSPVVPNHQRFDSIDNKQVFSGVWATYRPTQTGILDTYFLNLDHGRGAAAGLGPLSGAAYNVSTLGGNYVVHPGPTGGWLWDVQAMLQFGSWSDRPGLTQPLLARAYTTGAGYAFQELPMTPQFWVFWDYASGDQNPGTGVHGTFNQLFPFGHAYFGYIDVVGRDNINDYNCQFSLYPTKWMTTWIQYHVFRLDSPKDALYNAAGTAIRQDKTGQAGVNVGDEVDLLFNFHLSNHQDLFLSYSHLYAGDFIKKTGPGLSPDYTYLMYSFRW